jgi:hypothetical protein
MKRPKWIKVRNESDRRVVHEDLDIDVEPGQVCEVLEGYAMPRRAASGERFPSILEQVAPGLKPVEAEDLERWQKAPDAAAKAPAKMPTVKDLVAAGMPQGMAEMFIQAMEAQLAEAKKSLAESAAPKGEASTGEEKQPKGGKGARG